MKKRLLVVSTILISTSAFAAIEELQIFSMNEKTAQEKPFVITFGGAKAKGAYNNTMKDVAEVTMELDEPNIDWGGWSKTRGDLSCTKTYLLATPETMDYFCDVDLQAFKKRSPIK